MTGRDSPYIALALIYMSEKDFPEKFHIQNLHFNVEMRDSGFTKWRFVQLFTTLTKTEKMLMNLNPLLSQTFVSLFGAMGMMLVLLEVVSIVQQQLFVFLRFVLRVAAETSESGQAKTELWITVTATLSPNCYLTYNYMWIITGNWVRLKTDHNGIYFSARKANQFLLLFTQKRTKHIDPHRIQWR